MGVVLSTVGITVGHELVHQKSRFEQACGGILLASVCNGSFKIQHVRGHHQYVATPLIPPRPQWESVSISKFPTL